MPVLSALHRLNRLDLSFVKTGMPGKDFHLFQRYTVWVYCSAYLNPLSGKFRKNRRNCIEEMTAFAFLSFLHTELPALKYAVSANIV